ncbi:MAG: hypothetical protein VX749_04670 [Pseudomonadota bacterium]|jgi:hypothetical protein|nr:hypothetical protein [Pseudomonadota bacterium]|tara:strand:- start:1564 stop:1776 length:213 start_codon:yes stop_codon:yes gene_type:complete
MAYLFVVFLFIDDVWVKGDDLEGWASMPYETLESCQRGVERAKKIQEDLLLFNPKAHPKRFECHRIEEQE